MRKNFYKKSFASSVAVFVAAASAARLVSAGTSVNTAGAVYNGTSDGSSNYANNNPAVTISFSGQTALRTFDTTPGITELSPGTSIVLHNGTNGAPVTYTAPSDTTAYFQLASSDFTSPDSYPGSATNPGPANFQTNSAVRLEWHEQGSVDGEYDLINDEVGYVPVSSGGTGPISNEALRVASTSNPTWINTNKFTAGNQTINGFYLDQSSADVLDNTYSTTVYNQSTGVNLLGGQNRIQFSVGEYKTEGLSVSGTPSFNASAGSGGYGLGNPAIASASTYTGLGVAGVRETFQPASIVNESTNKTDPQTGRAYPTGPWNTAGTDNISSTQIAATAVGFSANPGTGLVHLNVEDTQWLQTTGRLQNGAVFNFVTRTVDTGQRIVAGLNTGIDPSWAVGTNDDGNSTSTTAANLEHSVGSGLRFSGKTSGTEAEKTIASSRMAVGVLSLPETRAAASNAPVRNLDIDFNTADGYSTNTSNFVHIDFDTIVSSNPSTRYQPILISQYNTIKSPNTAFAAGTAARWAAASTFDPATSETDGTPTIPVTGIKGDVTGDVAAFIGNIVNSDGSAAKGLTSVTVNNPADNLFINGFLIPGLLNYTRTVDGGPITPVTLSAAALAEQASVKSNYGNLFTADNTPGANSQTIGSSAAYAAGNSTNEAVNGTIPITAKDSSGNLLSNGTLAPAGNYLFGNFNQNGVRDFSAVKQAVNAALSLYAVDSASGGVNSIFTQDGGVANNTTVPSLIGTPGWVATGTNTKGDLITLGDFNGDGKFDGQDLYELAVGAALSDSTSVDTITATYATFGDAIRNPNLVLRKNGALTYINTYLNSNASPAGALFLRQTAAAVLSGTSVPAGATNLHTTDPVTGLSQFTYDPNGVNAFNPVDVNRDGVVDFNDAVLVDQYNGQSYSNLGQQLAAVESAPVTGVLQSVNLGTVQQIDGEAAISSADLAIASAALTGTGTTNWYGYLVNKTGPGTIVWARGGGQVNVYPGAAFQISTGKVSVGSSIDPFTETGIIGLDSTQSVAVTVSGTLEYSAGNNGLQLEKLAALNVASGDVVRLDASSGTGNVTALAVGSLLDSGSIDLGTGDLIVQGGSLTAVRSLVASGFNLTGGGNWTGTTGISSSVAAADTAHLTAVGVIQNNQSGSAIYGATHLFDGTAPPPADVLVKYTYFGDANLDGKIDGSDYSLIDAGYASHGILAGWYNGDFNYDGVIDGTDYALIDNAFNNQRAPLNAAALVATSTASPAAVPEPTSPALLATGLAAMVARRSRRPGGSLAAR